MSATNTMVADQIRQFIAETILFSEDGFGYGDDASFLDEGIIDSTGVVELVLFVEETYGFAVDDDDIVPDNFDTVNNLVRYVQERGGSQPD